MAKKSTRRTPKQLVAENQDLRARLDEAEETLHAIRSGEVDALIVSGVGGEQIFTLKQAKEQILHQVGLMESVNDAIIAFDNQYRVTFWNAGAESLYGWKAEQVLGRNGVEIIRTEWPDANAEWMWRTITEAGRWRGEVTQARKDGTRIPVEMSALVLRNGSGNVTGYFSVNHDITERKSAEVALSESRETVERYRVFFENIQEPITIQEVITDDAGNAIDLKFLEVNRAAELFMGKTRNDIVGRTRTQMSGQPDLEGVENASRVASTGKPFHMIRYSPGFGGWFESFTYSLGSKVVATLALNITERKQSEEAVLQSEARYRVLVEQASDGIFVTDSQGRYLDVNTSGCTMLGYTRDEILGMDFTDVLLPQDLEQDPPKLDELIAGKTIVRERSYKRKDGTVFPVELSAKLLSDGRIQNIVRDITERKRAEQQILSQLKRLAALREVDIAISGSFDIRIMLNVVLKQVIAQLHVDASCMLLFNPYTQLLEFAAGRGFLTHGIEQTRLRLGEGYAGLAALERRVVSIEDMEQVGNKFVRAPLVNGENFVSYYGVPLIAKGQVKGLLEIFQRSRLDPNEEWLDFLNALAGQAAIALDNAGMFDNLQRSNAELYLAYDHTIEGWSRALDLRDKETEGHTLRVTDMTLRLARAINVREDDLVHIRRGALLHDIGKIGVPDNILLKPGPLTDEEWVLMRRHPTISYELLAPIGYLRLALDIPYCHHEKWDGTGYPRGLKGEQIPLAARLFAVVDVWDALRSDRPYRQAWKDDKVIEHIRSQSGSHFDPKAVEAFLRLVK